MNEQDGTKELRERIAQLEAELAQERETSRFIEQEWQSIVESLPDVILRVGLDRKIQYVNKLTPGRKLSDVIGGDIYRWMAPESHATTDQALDRLITTGQPQVFEVQGSSKVGHPTWWLNRLGPVVRSGKVVGFTYSATDITAMKQAEQELARKAEELRRSNEELRQFAHVASHDLREPLRMVSSYLDLIRRRYGEQLGGEGQEFLQFAVDGARRMRALIEGLLKYAHAGSNPVPREPVGLDEVLSTARKDLEVALVESGLELHVDPLPTVPGDRILLTQLFENLISNAIKFRAQVSPRVEVRTTRAGADWQISVRDNGIGIEPQFLQEIFGIFRRLHGVGSYEGSGLGLAITKKIVERHGGRIWAISDGPGCGTTFHLTLPAA